MILIGILGLCVVIFLYILLSLYFIRRTDRFMDAWEKEIKEKIEKTTLEGLQSLEEATEAIKVSRMAIEQLAIEKGFVSKPAPEESSVPKITIETQVESMVVSTVTPYSALYERRKHKEWENWRLIFEPSLST